MLFNSFEFLVFFPIVTALFFSLSSPARWYLVLSASAVFYMWFKPIYILIILVTIVVDFWAGIFIERSISWRRTFWFWLSVVTTCGILAYFKYYNFIVINLNYAFLSDFRLLDILLPIGLSFHTFQSLSYVIEVYKGRQPAETNFWKYCVYVLFYPQLVAGPIERPGHLMGQIFRKTDFSLQNVTSGLRLITWGLFKKVVIADRLAQFVNVVYEDPARFGGLDLSVGTIFFAFQIYCDFSGYSDMAIGIARVMNIDLMRNFQSPYFSRSVGEFWRRWHISLSSWFRDYVYVPLGGSRTSRPRQLANILVVFALSGLWHGANWTFVIWGVLNGLAICMEAIVGLRAKPPSPRASILRLILTFTFICLTWIFFRAENVNSALLVVERIFLWSPAGANLSDLVGPHELLYGWIFISVLISYEYVSSKIDVLQFYFARPLFFRVAFYVLFVWIIIVFGVFEKNEFIYFQF